MFVTKLVADFYVPNRFQFQFPTFNFASIIPMSQYQISHILYTRSELPISEAQNYQGLVATIFSPRGLQDVIKFTDVTLAQEENKKIGAHKVILR